MGFVCHYPGLFLEDKVGDLDYENFIQVFIVLVMDSGFGYV